MSTSNSQSSQVLDFLKLLYLNDALVYVTFLFSYDIQLHRVTVNIHGNTGAGNEK